MDELTEQKLVKLIVKKLEQKYILLEKSFNLDNAESVQKDMFIDNIVNIVCKYLEVEKDRVLGKGKRGTLVTARILICYLCIEIPETPMQLTRIGKKINRDHSTVHHCIKVAKDFKDRDLEFRYQLNEVTKLVEQSLKL